MKLSWKLSFVNSILVEQGLTQSFKHLQQYQDVIRDHKAKKPVNLEELPIPPGYGPLPTSESAEPQQVSLVWRQDWSGLLLVVVVVTMSSKHCVRTACMSEDFTIQRLAIQAARQAVASKPAAQASAPSKPPPVKRPSPATPGQAAAPKSRNEKELHFLMERQKEFKIAALNAKKLGDMEQARNHLKAAKVIKRLFVVHVSFTSVTKSLIRVKRGFEVWLYQTP